MGRVIALGPGGKPQAPERADYFRGVIDVVRERGLLDEVLLSPRCRDYEHADEVRRGLYRSARYYCSCGAKHCTRRHANFPTEEAPEYGCPDGGQRISCRADVVTVTTIDENGEPRKHYHVQFRLHDKAESIRAVVQRYGPDPSRWPYFAKRKQRKADDDGDL